MTREEKENLVLSMTDELLIGGVMPSEWTVFVIREAEKAFVAGANLPSILTAQAAMECNLRHECGGVEGGGFASLIDNSDLPADLKIDLHKIRRYRNRWVHVHDPLDDLHLQRNSETIEAELEEMAILAMRSMLKVFYSWQGT